MIEVLAALVAFQAFRVGVTLVADVANDRAFRAGFSTVEGKRWTIVSAALYRIST